MAEQVGTRQLRVGSRLEWVLASGAFAVTAEIAPPASASPEDVRRAAALLRGHVGGGPGGGGAAGRGGGPPPRLRLARGRPPRGGPVPGPRGRVQRDGQPAGPGQ